MEFEVHNMPIPENGPICDFCSDPAVAWDYPANDSTPAAILLNGNVTLMSSIGNWAACEKCSALIEADDRSGLLNRTLASLPEEDKGVIPADALERLINTIHMGFWTNRKGSRKRAVGNA
uniref:Uncharacterized protein n=1 Tax=viral metagenome TaxID=1070528 RepID=A0A6M3IJQ6_9ZZZZ